MTTTGLVFQDLKLKAHPGYISYRTGWQTDGTDDIIMNFRLYSLAPNVLDAKAVVFDARNNIMGEYIANSPADVTGDLTLSPVVPSTMIDNTATGSYGIWHVNLTLKVLRITGELWEFDGRYDFTMTFVAVSPPPPPPPPPPDGCTDCGPGTHCESGICVPDPVPPPPPGWLEKLKALFPAQLQQYAIPIAVGTVYLV